MKPSFLGAKLNGDIRKQTYKSDTIRMPKRRYNQIERDRSSSFDKTRKETNRKESEPSDRKMISLKKARMADKKMNDLQSTKKIILGRESDQGEQEAERARKGRVSEATNNEMRGQVEFEEIHTESEFSQSDEENYNTSILDVFKEIEISGNGNWLFRALSSGTFGDQEYHLIVREVVWDYIDTNRNRF